MTDGARYDAIIIGGGPAGLTAGMYLARAGKKTLLLEQGLLGGQMATAGSVENYPGFPEGATGRELTALFEGQARRFGVDLQFGRVEALKASEPAAKEVVVAGFSFFAPVVVIATGLLQKLGIPGEDEYLGRGVSYCATCDGALYRGRPAAVVGSTEWAMEEAHFLARFASPLYLVIPTPALKATSDLRRELLAHPAVRVVGDVRPSEVLGDATGVTGLRVSRKEDGATSELAVDGVFVCAAK
jgi:thioredoxin reductase (NADPH)